jgi:hypothetical protein
MATRPPDPTSHTVIGSPNQPDDYNSPTSHDMLLPRPLPNTAEQQFEKWIWWQEGISMNTDLDNFAQNTS